MDAYLEMQNNEKRTLEDRVYQLEYDYEKALKELKACRAKLSGDEKDGAKATGQKNGKKDRKTLQDIIPDEQEPPKVELPPGFSGPDGQQTSTTQRRRANTDRAQGPIALVAATADLAPPPDSDANDNDVNDNDVNDDDDDDNASSSEAPTATTQRVDHIFLNPRLTGGQDFDQQPGDDGLSVLIEPRDKQGHFLPQPAKISIVLLDPAKKGENVRVARWDFDPDVTAKLLSEAPLDRGIHLRMPWLRQSPEHEHLQLFVRYWCPDGRKLEASREIDLRLPSQTPSAWTRRTAPPEATVEPAVAASTAAQATEPEPIQVTPVPLRSPAASSATDNSAVTPRPSKTVEQPAVADRPGRFWKPSR